MSVWKSSSSSTSCQSAVSDIAMSSLLRHMYKSSPLQMICTSELLLHTIAIKSKYFDMTVFLWLNANYGHLMGVINATVCYHMRWTAGLGFLIGGGASATSIDIVAVQEYVIKTRQAEITIRQKTRAFVYYHQSVSHRVFCCCQYYCNYDRRNKFHLLFTAAFTRPVTATVVPELITPLRHTDPLGWQACLDCILDGLCYEHSPFVRPSRNHTTTVAGHTCK